MKQLKLSIKPKQEPTEGQSLNSSGYSVKINDWELGRGVTGFRLEMSANGKPKITIDFTPDIIEVDNVAVDLQILEAFDRAYSDFTAKTQNEKEQSEQELKKAIQRLKTPLVGKYLELSGDLAGRIEAETEKALLVRRAMLIDGHIGLCEQAVYVDKKVLDSYWAKIVDLSAAPEIINNVDSAYLIRKWLNM